MGYSEGLAVDSHWEFLGEAAKWGVPATPLVQQDICEKLQLHTPKIFQQPFTRPNLSYSVLQADAKQARLVHIISKVPGTAIVYCRSRRRTQEVAALLQMHGFSADYYHAGLKSEDRSARQQQWMEGQHELYRRSDGGEDVQ